MHEPRFTGELLAAVLSIPAGKSLLRRHLFTRFSELVGPDVLRQKREVEDNQSIAPLRPDSKVKVNQICPISGEDIWCLLISVMFAVL